MNNTLVWLAIHKQHSPDAVPQYIMIHSYHTPDFSSQVPYSQVQALYLLCTPGFRIRVSHVFRRLDGGDVFKNPVTEPYDADD